MYDELDLVPESSFAQVGPVEYQCSTLTLNFLCTLKLFQDLVTDELDSFALSTGKMEEIEDLRSVLARQKTDAEHLMESLWSRVNSLWERLEVPESEKAKVKSQCQGIKPVHIKSLKQVKSISNF